MADIPSWPAGRAIPVADAVRVRVGRQQGQFLPGLEPFPHGPGNVSSLSEQGGPLLCVFGNGSLASFVFSYRRLFSQDLFSSLSEVPDVPCASERYWFGTSVIDREVYCRMNGIPKCSSNRVASASLLAVVVIVTCSPRNRSMLL